MLVAVAVFSISCNGAGGDADQDLNGVATLALTANEGVVSVNVDFQGGTRTVSRCVEVDGSPTTRLSGLPTGAVLVNASAYPVPGCQGEPTWVAAPQTVQLAKGRAVAISIVFHPNGTAVISTTYVDDGTETDAGAPDGGGGSIGVPFVVKANLVRPAAVATNGQAVVWSDAGNVRMCRIEGCGADSPSNLVRAFVTGEPVVNAIALDDTYAYWLAGSAPVVQRCPFTGCLGLAETMVDAKSSFFQGLAVQNSTIYVNDSWNVYQCPTSGGPALNMFGALDSSHTYLATDETGLYFGLGGEAYGTYYCAFASCPPKLGHPLLSSVGRMVARGGVVYILEGYSLISSPEIGSCPNTGCSNLPTILATGQKDLTAMAVDSLGLYWTISQGPDVGATGEVRMCPLPNCVGGPRVLATAQENPVSIAAHDGHVFWVNRGLTGSNGAIMGVNLQ